MSYDNIAGRAEREPEIPRLHQVTIEAADRLEKEIAAIEERLKSVRREETTKAQEVNRAVTEAAATGVGRCFQDLRNRLSEMSDHLNAIRSSLEL